MAWTGQDPTKILSVYSAGYGYGPNIGLQREDLLDLITNIEPWDNIVFAMLPKRRAKSTTHEWPVDTNPVVSRAGVPDGSAFEAQGQTTPFRLRNFTQIFRWDVEVTGTEAAVDVAGMGDKLAYQILNGTHAMAKAVEQRIFDMGTAATGTFVLQGVATSLTSVSGFTGATGMVPGYGGPPGLATGQTGGSTASRLMAPLFQLVPSLGLPAAWTYPFVTMTDGTLTATRVDDVCEILFNNGAKPETLVVHPGVKRDLALDLTSSNALNTRFIQATERKVIRGVDVYEGELCTLSVIPNRSIGVPAASAGTAGYGVAWVLQKDKLGIAFLRPITASPLAKVGDSERKMLLGELTLELLHPVAAGGVARITT